MEAMDISLFMKTPDFIGGALRIDTSRDEVWDFIMVRPNDRIGIISFAGRSCSEALVSLVYILAQRNSFCVDLH